MVVLFKKPELKTTTIGIIGSIFELEHALKGTKYEGRKLLGLPIKIGGETMGWIDRVDDDTGHWYARIDVGAEVKEE